MGNTIGRDRVVSAIAYCLADRRESVEISTRLTGVEEPNPEDRGAIEDLLRLSDLLYLTEEVNAKSKELR
jgi:hypothetical protein